MFRFNNPDALLTLLLVAAAYALTRALEHGGTRWLVLAGVLIGFGFLTKMLQAFVVVPGFAAVYLLAAPVSIRRRLLQLARLGRRDVRGGRVVGGDRDALARFEPALHRRLAGQQHPEPDLRLQRPRPDHRQRARERRRRPGLRHGNGCRRRGGREHVGLDRHHAALRLGDGNADLLAPARGALLHRRPALGHAARPRGPTGSAPRCSSGAPGSSSRASSSASCRESSIPTTRLSSRPRSGHSSGSGSRGRGRAGTTSWPGSPSPRLLRSRPSGGSSCSIGRLRGIRRCASRCSSAGIASAVFVAAGPAVWGGNRAVGRAVLLASLVFALAAPAAYAAQTASTAHSGSLPSAGPAGSVRQGGPGGGGGRGGFAPPGRRRPVAFGGPPGGFSPTGGAGLGRGGGAGALGGLLDSGTPSKALVAALSANASSYRWVAAIVGCEQRRRRPARRRQAGDGDRRLQRHRPVTDARAVQGVCRRREDPLLRRERRRRRRARQPAARPPRARSRPGSSRTSPRPPSAA